jgi:hypothetical protein
MAPELRLRLPFSPVALAIVLAVSAIETVAPVPWLTESALANHCTPPCDCACACDCNCACDAGCSSAYRPPACD